jgi:aspartyl-tRNA(Asn)/glutamyl-tRNA(Gln) amidotransferase subunit B
MSYFIPTIGLEIHAELKTATKMFCGCANNPDEHHPNINVCPVCLGHPGVLPTINREAVRKVIAVGLALNGSLPAGVSKFDRKNYFYPDLPKGYQISQYDQPLIVGGSLKGVRLRRIHLEEDTARLLHQLPGASGKDPDSSYIDFNRSGIPLMELVTEPDITSAEQALEFAKELQLILRYLGASDADMEKGQMRVEANISVAEHGGKLGTKVEVKNLNSFRAVKDAIAYEIERQAKILEGGGTIIQETRGWDERGVTVSQRIKEEAHDYRYMPEPDLPPIRIVNGRASPIFGGLPKKDEIDEINVEEIKATIPELPEAKRVRFASEFNLPAEQIELLVEDADFASYFEQSVSELNAVAEKGGDGTQLLVNYLLSDLRGLIQKTAVSSDELSKKIPPVNFAHLVSLITADKISSRTAKDMLVRMFESGLDPHQILEADNLGQITDEDELMKVVDKVIISLPKAVRDYRQGKMNAIEALVGRAMSELKGRGNPELLRKLLVDRLSK